MTALEACELVVQLTRHRRRAEADAEMWQQLALSAFAYASELRRELEMVDARAYVHRTRTQEQRDLWLDHADLRREEAA